MFLILLYVLGIPKFREFKISGKQPSTLNSSVRRATATELRVSGVVTECA